MKKIVAANNEIRIKNDHTFLLRYTNIYVGTPVTEEVDSLTERVYKYNNYIKIGNYSNGV